MNRAPTHLRAAQRRATALVLTAVCLPLLLAMAALSVDVGYMYFSAADLQNAADAAALAGASAFSERANAQADTRARAYLRDNVHSAAALSAVVELGRWDTASATFTVVTDERRANAVRVVATLSSVPTFFAGILGFDTFKVTREATATAEGSRTCRIWGLENSKMSGGSATDSYYSTDGPYNPAFAGSEGSVCSCEDIQVTGGTDLRGDALHGQGHAVSISGTESAVSGEISPIESCIEPIIDFGDAATTNNNGLIGMTDQGEDPWKGPNELHVKSPGDNLDLPPGTYYFESLDLSQSTLTLSGPTTIYVTGVILVTGGGAINTSQDPLDLSIYCSGPKVTWNGSSDFYGQLIAPQAVVGVSGSGDYFGAAIGKEFDLDYSKLHVDLSLPMAGLIKTTTRLVK